MSAFNTLEVGARCPVCRKLGPFEVQFKYGDTWQHEYRVGDEIRWGGNDYGKRSAGTVRIEGVGGPCSNCSADDLSFAVTIVDNRIVSVEPVQQAEMNKT